MVVIPTDTHVRLEFERSRSDLFFYGLSILGLGLAIFARFRGDWNFPRLAATAGGAPPPPPPSASPLPPAVELGQPPPAGELAPPPPSGAPLAPALPPPRPLTDANDEEPAGEQ
jgi:hypothetical protein